MELTCIHCHYVFQIRVLFHLWITWPLTRQSLPFGQRFLTDINWFNGIHHIVLCKTLFNVWCKKEVFKVDRRET